MDKHLTEAFLQMAEFHIDHAKDIIEDFAYNIRKLDDVFQTMKETSEEMLRENKDLQRRLKFLLENHER